MQTATDFVATDAGAIAWSLINTQNARGTTRLRSGAIAASVNRDRTYIEGSIVADSILELAEADNGFYFLVDPVDGVPGIFGEFVVRWPLPGGTAQSAMFGYGDGTVANLAGYTITTKLPVNRIRATGATVGEQVLDSYKEDTSSQARFDILDGEVSFSGVDLQATLDQNAQSSLFPLPQALYEVQTLDTSTSGALGGVFVPSMYDEFDLGDQVKLAIRHGRVNVIQNVRIAQTKTSVSDEGTSEKLENMLMMEV